MSSKLREARTPVIWSLNKDPVLGDFSREGSLTLQVPISREITNILMLVSMINKLKLNSTSHVFTDLQKVVYILFLSTELV